MQNSKRGDVSFIPCHFIRFPHRLRAISVISVPDLALADRAIHRVQVLKANLIFYSYSKLMRGLPVQICNWWDLLVSVPIACSVQGFTSESVVIIIITTTDSGLIFYFYLDTNKDFSVHVLTNIHHFLQLLHSAVEHVEKKARGQHGTLTICCKNFDLVKLKFNNIEEALNVASSIEVLSTIGRSI